MLRNCYTYLIKWSNTNKSYYGVRYAKGCTPEDLWVTYFTSSKFVHAYRKLHGEPDLIKIRKVFGDDPVKAKLWEEKVLKRLNCVYNNDWLNQSNNNSFRGQSSSWNDGLTKETCPILTMVGQKISNKLKGRKATSLTKEIRRISAQKTKRENSWRQLKSKSECYNKYETYADFLDSVLKEYESCWKIPMIIAKKLGVTESGVTTLLKHEGLDVIKNQKISKVFLRYSSKFSSYYEYAIKILELHTKGYTPYQISSILKINEWGVKSLLTQLNLTPNYAKSGPSSSDFQERLITDTLEIMGTTKTIENNTLPQDIIMKLREFVR